MTWVVAGLVVCLVAVVLLCDAWRRRARRLSRKIEAQRALIQAVESRLVRAQVINAVFVHYLRRTRDEAAKRRANGDG